MQERQVTIGDTTYPLPDPFLVLATQNPLEQEGTYQLPEAQLDRFMLKLRSATRPRRRSARFSISWPPPRRDLNVNAVVDAGRYHPLARASSTTSTSTTG